MINQKLKRFICVLLGALMIFSLAACNQNSKPQGTSASDESKPGNVPTDLTVRFHYLRDDGNYANWSVWLWINDGSAYSFGEEVDADGVMTTAKFPAGTSQIGFIVRLGEWEAKDVDADQFIDLSAVLAGTVDVYVKSGIEGYEMKLGDDVITGTVLKSAVMSDDFMSVTLTLSDNWEEDMKAVLIDKNGKIVDTTLETNGTSVVMNLVEKADEFGEYSIMFNGSQKKEVKIPDVFSSAEFEEKYYYEGNDLGANYSASETVFKVWAPTATALTLNLYESGDKSDKETKDTIEMTSGDKGVWSATVSGDLNGIFYTYTASFDEKTNKDICDPYAKAVGVNGDRAMVIDLSTTNPEGWDNDKNPNAGLADTDSIIYEVSIRDTTMDASSGVTNKGQYLGMIETGTINSNGDKTGLDHIVSLGVTHVQIMPSYDFATINESKDPTTQYNWGYDPKNYNVPEGSFSSDPYDGAVRIREYKQMVMGLHAAGLSVNMDVVYNHTYNTKYCYNMLVPGYFYRPESNGSGCGNDVASERAMVRKFIVDSVTYWASEYHLDGFRFDLVGLLDVDTINAIRESVDTISKDIMLYGEGWSLGTGVTKYGTELATQANINKLTGFAMFNDNMRDALKGSVFNATEKGYINDGSKYSTVMKNLSGIASWSKVPSQIVNYTSCHDNMTLWDEISSSNGDDSLEDRIKQNLMGASAIYLSQGIPFMLSGEEMLRTKVKEDGTFDSNSYTSKDSVNSMKWDTLADANYQTVLNFYKGMIAFRKAHAVLSQMDYAADCYKEIETEAKAVIAYEVEPADGEVSDGIVMIFNPEREDVTVTLPDGEWTICVQGTTAGTESLGTASGSITVHAIETVVLVKGALK